MVGRDLRRHAAGRGRFAAEFVFAPFGGFGDHGVVRPLDHHLIARAA